jgi:nucleoside-triphosphatase THEP1
MTTDQTIAPFAAAVYTPNTADRMALLKFVEKLKSSNIRVGGVLQEALFDSAGAIVGLDAVDVATNQRIPISRPSKNDDECGLDVSALAETTRIIRDAINERLDLVVVEKFGELEQDGRGLIDEIFQTIAEGIPLLISVPEAALPVWQQRSGELGSVLAFSEQDFQQWWQNLNQADPAVIDNQGENLELS